MGIDYENGYEECNLEKYKCLICGKQFIVGKEMLDENEPICPYCKNEQVEKIVWTEDEDLKELDLGCLSLMREVEDNEKALDRGKRDT